MRNLEDIENELAAAREALSSAEGTPAEVYSRIVGYYRSVRNWNRGKREEYGERKLFSPSSFPVSGRPGEYVSSAAEAVPALPSQAGDSGRYGGGTGQKLRLFVRSACPACPAAKDAASRLGLPVELVDADTDAGLAEAAAMQVMSTPTGILFSASGKEIARARDARTIAGLSAFFSGGNSLGAEAAGKTEQAVSVLSL